MRLICLGAWSSQPMYSIVDQKAHSLRRVYAASRPRPLQARTRNGAPAATTLSVALLALSLFLWPPAASAAQRVGIDGMRAVTMDTAATAPVLIDLPVITDEDMQGEEIASTDGTWSPAATSYAYQWQRSADGGSSWSDIPGANSATYTLAAADVGDMVQAEVTATNDSGWAVADSGPSSVILSGSPANTALPTIAGVDTQGQEIAGTEGTWSPAATSYAYQWQRSPDGGNTWSDIPQATAFTYSLAAADIGDEVRIEVTASNESGWAVADSAPSGVVVSGSPANAALPVLAGTDTEGQQLTATSGTWSPAATSYAYQWQRSPAGGDPWSDIPGATGDAYTLVAADIGDEVQVEVTATNGFGSAVADSGPSGVVISGAPANTALPALSGIDTEGQQLAGTNGTWSPAATSYAYQWQRSADGGVSWSDISSAKSATYTLTAADVGDQIRIEVTAINPYGSGTVAAIASGTVASSGPASTSAPSITGVAERGQQLTAGSGSWNPTPTAYAYQWQRDEGAGFVNVPGATSDTYTPSYTEETCTFRVTVTATDGLGQTSVDSAAVGPVQPDPPSNTVAPTISGTAQRTDTLTLTSAGTWGGSGDTYTYQWQRSADGATWTSIAGATSANYSLVAADDGDHVRILVTASNPDGSRARAARRPGSCRRRSAQHAGAAVTGTAQRSFRLTGRRGPGRASATRTPTSGNAQPTASPGRRSPAQPARLTRLQPLTRATTCASS